MKGINRNGFTCVSDLAVRVLILNLVLVLGRQSTQAADISWIKNNGTYDFNSGANWAGGVVPGSGDTALITNSITAVTSITDRTVQVTLNSLTISNNTTLAHRLILSNATFGIAATTLLGSNAVVALGTGGGSSSSIFSNNDLFLARNAIFQFNSSNNPSSLIVEGTFTNSTGNVMTNAGGGAARLFFAVSQPVTNNGTLTFVGSTAGTLLNTGLVIQVGTSGMLDTFYNAGSIRLGNASSLSAGVSLFSNQFVNAGVLVLTNNIASGSSSNFIFVTGATSGSAITNAASGTIKLVIAGGTIPRNELAGATGLVNLGTLTADTVSGTAPRTNSITLGSGSTFSNSLGGQVLVIGSPAGVLQIQADFAANAGTNLVNAGTLIYADSSGGAGQFANSGFIQLTNSTLRVLGDLLNSGAVVLGGAATGTNTIIVGGAFANAGSGIITNFRGTARVLCTDGSQIATNSGTMTFVGITAGSALNTGLVLQVGTAGALNTFYNDGALAIGNAETNTTRYFVLSNALVNAGNLLITNNATTGTNFVFITGAGIGAALTNESTGTIELTIGAGAGRRNVLTNAGDVVNLGTLMGETTGAQTNVILLVAGRAFSTGLGGQLIVSGATNGSLRIQADRIVNAGSNIINAGTLGYFTSSGAAPVLENSGTVLFNGGFLSSLTSLTNTVTGTIKLTSTATVTGSAFVNFGTISLANGQTLTFTGSALTNGSSAILLANGGILDLRGSLLNSSTASNDFNFGSGTLLFQSNAGTFTLAGKDLGQDEAGTNNNFFVNSLQLTGHNLTLSGSASSALYVGNLIGDAAATLNLNGRTVYFTGSTNGFLGTINLQAGQILPTSLLFQFLPTSGVQDWDTAANWDRNAVPVDPLDRVLITAPLTANLTVMQNTSASAFTIRAVTIGNSSGNLATLLVQRNQTWTDRGTISSGGMIVVPSGVTLSAPITVAGGTLDGGGVISGPVAIATPGTLNATNGSFNLSGSVMNSGKIRLRSTGTLVSGVVTNLNGGAIIADAGGNIAGTVFNSNGGSIQIPNNGSLSISDLANEGVVTITGSTLYVNNFSLVSAGSVKFGAPGLSFPFPNNMLVVGGQFISAPTNSLVGQADWPFQILFTNTSNIVTNQGTLTCSLGLFTPSNIRTGLLVQVGSAATPNTLYNNGTITVTTTGSSTTPGRHFVYSNRFVNAGLFEVNNSSTSASGTNFSIITGGPGTALTNESTGTIRLNGNGGIHTLLQLNAGGFVNLGTLQLICTSTWTTRVFLAEAGAVFSNALGGQVIAGANFGGNLIIQAGRAVNVGTNVLNSGTLFYLTSSGSTGVLENAGTLLFRGGFLNVDALTNQPTGQIPGIFTNVNATGMRFINLGFVENNIANKGVLNIASGGVSVVNLSGGLINLRSSDPAMSIVTNSGTIASVAGGTINTLLANIGGGNLQVTNGFLSVTGGITNANGTINLRSSGTLTGGIVTNLGSINAVAGGNIDSALVNLSGGTINATSGVLRLTGSLAINNGVINVGSAGTLTGSAVTNAATISAAGAGNIDANVANLSSGTLGVGTTADATLRMSGDLSNEGLIVLGRTSGASTLSNNNLYLAGGGLVQFIASGSLTVAGVFTNSPASVMTNAGIGAIQLRFTSTSNIATNRGAMRFSVNSGTAGSVGFVVQVGSAASPNTFYNQGTFVVGGAGINTYLFSNQFVNAGSFVMSNAATSASGNLVAFSVNGVSGAALTNEATGTMRFVANGIGSTVRNLATLNAGGFVNLGVLKVVQTGGTTNNLNDIILSQAATTFSNAAGGQFIVEPGNIGNVRIRADNAVNLGANIVNGGTLSYLNSAGAANALNNLGVLELSNANFVAGAGLTNASGGVIRSVGGTSVIVTSVVNRTGGTVLSTNSAFLKLNAGFASTLNSGTIDVRADSTISNGAPTALPIDNRGAIRLEGTLVASTVTNAGTIAGTGTLSSGLVTTNGTVSPGLSIGKLTINGGAVFSNTTLVIELGASPGVNDQLAINGGLTVTNSTLSIIPSVAGNIYTAVTFTAGQLVGEFPNPDPSTYNIIHDNANGIITIEVIALAAPPNLGVSPSTGLDASGEQGGPFAPSSQIYALTNTGSSALNWAATTSDTWLDLSDTNGALAASAGTNVIVSIADVATNLVGGLYSNVVNFVNLTNGSGTTYRVATLLVRDGVPDAWRTQYFGHVDPRASDMSRAHDDPDADGCDNLCESTAGFNPANSAAYPHVISLEKAGVDIKATYLGADGDNTWSPGIASRTNVLEFATGSGNGSYSNNFQSTGLTNILSGGNGLGVVTNMIDSGGVTNVPARYYRVRIVP